MNKYFSTIIALRQVNLLKTLNRMTKHTTGVPVLVTWTGYENTRLQ
jgi:hypothetical protein